jgi:hypothetical protein
MEYANQVIQILSLNWERALMGGVLVPCTVIFIMGVMKRLLAKTRLFTNKNVRKAFLAFVSLAMAFPITAFYFFADGISFDYYWLGCLGNCMLTIVTYWLYENTCLRNLIHVIGEKTVGKYWEAIKVIISEKQNEKALSHSLAMTTDELKDVVKKEIKRQVKEDNDLEGL